LIDVGKHRKTIENMLKVFWKTSK